MKTKSLALLALLALHAAPTFAASPLIGRWALDVAALPMPPEARPRSVTMEFSQPGDGLWSTHIEIVDPNGGTMDSDATLALDGTPGRITGSYWADVGTARMPAPNVVVLQLAYQGTPSSTRIYSVTEDGSTLTETKAAFHKDGTPFLQTTMFKRMP